MYRIPWCHASLYGSIRRRSLGTVIRDSSSLRSRNEEEQVEKKESQRNDVPSPECKANGRVRLVRLWVQVPGRRRLSVLQQGPLEHWSWAGNQIRIRGRSEGEVPRNGRGLGQKLCQRKGNGWGGRQPKHWHGTVSTWSSSEVRGIVQAARRNTSVENVAVAPAEIANVKADAVARIVQSLRCIAEFEIQSTSTEQLPVTETIDRLVYGIVNNQSSQLTHFTTVYSVGFEAMKDLAARFPANKVLKLGYSNTPCHVSESFALACVKAFSCLPNLKQLYLHARCSQSDISRLVVGIHGPRALQTLVVHFVREHAQLSRPLQELAVL